MRRPAALLGLALLAAALGVAACKPSSLTPFGLGTRGTEETGVNGQWQGVTSTGGTITFQVASDEVTTVVVYHLTSGCTTLLQISAATALVTDNTFEAEELLTPGRFIVDGTFTSSTSCSGSYFFEAIGTSAACPSSGSGTFVATKAQ
jgi:hypothetical protein